MSPLFDPEILAAVKITLVQSFISAVLATLIGTALAFLLPRSSRWTRVLLGAPFGVPAVVAAAAWTLILPASIAFSLRAVIVAHVFFNAPWVALWVNEALGHINAVELEAAATLGASRGRIFREVLLRQLWPTIGSVFTQVFSFCAMSFILVMILGGGPPVETLETTLFAKIRSGGLDLHGAAACAFWQILITLVPWLILRGQGVRRLETGRSWRKLPPPNRGLSILGLGIAVFFLLPYATLFRGVHFSPVLSDPEVLASLKVSAKLALATALLTLAISGLGVWGENRSPWFSKFGSTLLVLPSGISVMVLGLGFFVVFGKWIDPFSPSLWPVIILQTVFFVPIAFRVFQPVGRSRDRSGWDAALTLGASPLDAFRFVEWPRWRKPVFGMFFLIAGAALGEVAAVSLFYNEDRIPASLLISRWVGHYQFEDAQSLSVILLLLSVSLIAAGSLYSHGYSPEVENVAR